MTSGCFCRQGSKTRRTPGAESLNPVFLSLPLRNLVSPLYFQKGNKSVRILMSRGGNAGTAGMHWEEPISPKSNPSPLQAAAIICAVAQALPQILSDLRIPSFPCLLISRPSHPHVIPSPVPEPGQTTLRSRVTLLLRNLPNRLFGALSWYFLYVKTVSPGWPVHARTYLSYASLHLSSHYSPQPLFLVFCSAWLIPNHPWSPSSSSSFLYNQL